MRKQGLIYLGLFIIVFGLYAAQLKKRVPIEKKTVSVLADSTPAPVQQNRIQILYDRISAEKFFSNRISGVKLSPEHAPVNNDFTITLSGEEIFTDEGFSIHESWSSLLDSLAEMIKNEQGLVVEISGFADEDNPKEKNPGDYGSSALAFSFARAEWLAHYFERKHGMIISKFFILRGMGAVPQGKKIEMRFFYHSSLSGAKNSGAF